MPIELLKASEVRERVVALVHYGPSVSGLRPGEYYQVTIDPHRFSPCGRFIRLGYYPGDELIGWQDAESIYVATILAPWPDGLEHTMLELPWYDSPALSDA